MYALSRSMAASLQVKVVYIEPGAEQLVTVALNPGACVADALQAAGLAVTANVDLASLAVGIYGRLVTLATPLQNLDRVEIYRPLVCDPKEARRQRARKGPPKSS